MYGRAGERCTTCGRGIIRRTVSRRPLTHFCPWCQRLPGRPAPEPANARRCSDARPTAYGRVHGQDGAPAVAVGRSTRGGRAVRRDPRRPPRPRVRDPRPSPASARPASPTSASRWPTPGAATWPGRPRPRAWRRSRSAALAHLLPPGIGDERADLVKVMSEVRPVLLEQGQHGRLVLFVDDMHLLDVTSAAFIGQLLDADLLFLVGTVRDGEALPGRPRRRLAAGRVRRIDLTDLHRNGVDTLLHLVLGGPVERTTINDFWEASRGNPLYVRELVLGALDGGHLFVQHGVWRLVGPLITTPRLREVVAARLRSLLAAGARRPRSRRRVGTGRAWRCSRPPSGATRWRRSTARVCSTVRVDGRRQVVTLSHPQYREILRDRMPVLTRRRLLLDLADRIEAHGARRRDDPIRVALARLDATGSADAALLVQAARLARTDHDFVRVERLGRRRPLGGRDHRVRRAVRRGPPRARPVRGGRAAVGARRGRGGRRRPAARPRRGDPRPQPDVGPRPRRRRAGRQRRRPATGHRRRAPARSWRSTRRCCAPTPATRRAALDLLAGLGPPSDVAGDGAAGDRRGAGAHRRRPGAVTAVEQAPARPRRGRRSGGAAHASRP